MGRKESEPTTPAAFLLGWAEAVGGEVDATTGYPSRIRRGRDGGVMALIPAGTFAMGAVPEDGRARDSEKPRHRVTLTRAYYMDTAEVTIGQWRAFVTAGKGSPPTLDPALTDDRLPIHQITWDEASAFARWVGASLPTEAQWERAARDGKEDLIYPWGMSDAPDARNGVRSPDGFDGLAPVKSFAASGYGLHDMIGNAWEWCTDFYDGGSYATGDVTDPTGETKVHNRVMRGGGYTDDLRDLRTSYRRAWSPEAPLPVLGFRCAKTLP